MAELRFAITGAAPIAFAASPQLGLDVRIDSDAAVESVLLRTSVRIEAGARATTPVEDARLKELFGVRAHWSRGSRSLLWAQVASVVSAFSASASLSIALPCSYDLAAIASKYLRALDGGKVLLRAQFSGTVFSRGDHGLSAMPIPLDREAEHALPVQTWLDVVDEHFHGSAVLAMRRDLYDRLDRLRIERGHASWDQMVEALLARAGDAP